MVIGFCCTGNTCRSPMAEAMLIKALRDAEIDNIKVFSFGVACYGAMPMSAYSKKCLDNLEIPHGIHYSRAVNQELYDECDYIIAMTGGHASAINARFGKNNKVMTLAESIGESGDVNDPFMGCYEEYYKVALQLLDFVSKLARNIAGMI